MTALRLAHRRLHSRTRAILQTALAALAAWYLSVLLLPDPQPLFACIATVCCIGASHGEHRERALQLVVGVVLGLALADMLMHVIGTGAPQLALMIVLAMSAAVLLNGSELVISEAAVSAMLLIMAAPNGFTANRILEAIIGGTVALAVAVLFPPDPALHVGRAGQAVFGELGRALERVAGALEQRDAGRAEDALRQARAIDGLIDTLDATLATGRETVRTAPPRFGAREPVERYDRSFEQVDLAVRNTRVLARHAGRALRAGRPPDEVAPAVAELARAVWALAAAYDQPERAGEARERARRAAADAPGDALGECVRSTAVDLMRAADLVADASAELPSEERLLGLTPHDDLLRRTAEAAEARDECPWVATLAPAAAEPPRAALSATR
ncbi:MAG TPA: FUSC family protein [Solirubrobacter sp.]|nr:FUSC family protein [Solirubrobacter sp.]